MDKISTIEFIGEKKVEVTDNQTILDAALVGGISHYHACGGNARCSTCRVVVCTGEENLSPPNEAEIDLRQKRNFPANVRLACQTSVKEGTVKLRRIIKDEQDAQIYIYNKNKDLYQSLGEEKELAFFFLDIRNFTTFIENHLPFDVIHIIRKLSFTFRRVIDQNNGRVIESAGDGFYAVFGIKENIKEAAENAVKSGEEIIEELKKFNDEYLKQYFAAEFNVGIGIHTGNVIVGTNGFAGEDSISVMGFPVNIASRIEQATKELDNNFVISEDVYSLLKTKENYPSTEIKVKGISDNIKVRLLGKTIEPTTAFTEVNFNSCSEI